MLLPSLQLPKSNQKYGQCTELFSIHALYHPARLTILLFVSKLEALCRQLFYYRLVTMGSNYFISYWSTLAYGRDQTYSSFLISVASIFSIISSLWFTCFSSPLHAKSVPPLISDFSNHSFDTCIISKQHNLLSKQNAGEKFKHIFEFHLLSFHICVIE